jgi:hypothetical protein
VTMLEPPGARRASAGVQRPEQPWQIEHKTCTLFRQKRRFECTAKSCEIPIGVARCAMPTGAEGAGGLGFRCEWSARRQRPAGAVVRLGQRRHCQTARPPPCWVAAARVDRARGARGPLTLRGADDEGRGLKGSNKQRGLVLFYVCNRLKENSGWVPEREHTAPNGKWKLLDVR